MIEQWTKYRRVFITCMTPQMGLQPDCFRKGRNHFSQKFTAFRNIISIGDLIFISGLFFVRFFLAYLFPFQKIEFYRGNIQIIPTNYER
ncbi:hypothetical protein DMA11_17120 [Marinilabiliaceae bacterium JC017]|nr:hypothetical protein DMA11_17120 [Marinilabiliaceae bacterium JC017]